MGTTTPELASFLAQIQDVMREAIELLDAANVENEAEEFLRRWALVMGVLALDVLQSVALLLDAGQRRTASMLARALVDYDVRLRYYVVQAQKPIADFRRGKIKRKTALKRIDAAKHWKNADASLLLGIVRGYDDEFISEKARKGLRDLIDRNESSTQQSFAYMHAFLVENEVRVRGVMPIPADRLLREYRNMKPNWHMQSAFLHGDQAIITDVTHYGETGRDQEIFWKSPIDGNRTIAFTAISHARRLLRTFAMLLPYVPHLEQLVEKEAEVWRATPADSSALSDE